MSVRSVSFVPGEYYHIFNRGTDKREIFHDDVDRQRFIKLLYIANSDRSVVVRDFSKNIYNTERGKQLISIGAYCLMPNHFHLLVTQTENGDISKFMLKLCTAYSMYYNKKYSTDSFYQNLHLHLIKRNGIYKNKKGDFIDKSWFT